jgi:two-component system, chemotaxis family, sensor kinase CheA
MDDEYRDIFVSEAQEHLQNLNNGLLSLESNKNDEESINVIFRACHTIKGNAGTMGFTSVQELAHKMEDLFDLVRKKEINLTTDIVDLLFECMDKVEWMLNNISEGGDGSTDVSSLVSRLLETMGSSDCLPVKKDVVGNGSVCFNLKLDKNNMKKVLDFSKKGFLGYSIIFTVANDCSFKSLRAQLALRKVRSAIDVILVNPTESDLVAEKFDFDFLIFGVSKDSVKNIKSKIGVVPEIVNIDIQKVELKENVLKNLIVQKSNVISNSKGKNSKVNSEDGSKKDNISSISESNGGVSDVSDKSSSKSSETVNSSSSVVKSVQSVRIGIDQLDKLMDLVGELAVAKMRLDNIKKEHKIVELDETLSAIDRQISEMQEEVTKARMVQMDHIFGRYPRLVRDLSKNLNKKIDLVIEGSEIELDRTVLDRIGDPLVHLLRNSIDHGIELPDVRVDNGKNETGIIKLIASRQKDHVLIEIKDDGCGISVEKVKEVAIKKGILSEEQLDKMDDDKIRMLIFAAGFSTAEKVTDLSGRGVGMDVVKNTIESLGGLFDLKSVEGEGTVISLKLPLTLAIIEALLTNTKDEVYCFPLNVISETIEIRRSDIKTIQGMHVIILRNRELPIVYLQKIFDVPLSSEYKEEIDDKLVVVVVERSDGFIGVVVDEVVGEHQIIIKAIGSNFKSLKGIGGSTILGDGSIALIVDISTLV